MARHRRGVTDPGLLAGRYRLIEPVGRGAVAEVWRAEDVTLSRLVAVKVLGPSSSSGGGLTDRAAAAPAGSDPGSPEQVWQEAQHTARLTHPNVVQVYDAGSSDGRLFLVTELVAGRDLAVVLREQGPLEPSGVARIGAQAARALAAAHGAGLAHRDVKPGNLLVAADGTVKLADFGIAAPIYPAPVHPAAEGGAQDDAGPLVGTAAYVAPERIMGHPASPASDLYALGCVLYELLTGRPPHTADTTRALLELHLHEMPEPPGRLRPDVPAELEQAVMRLLAKNPAERPSDAAVVAGVLEAIAGTAAPRPAGQGPYPAPEGEPGTATQVLPTLLPTGRRRPRGGPARSTPTAAEPPPPVTAWLVQRPLLAAALAAAVLIAIVSVIVVITESGGRDPATARPGAPPAAASPSPEPTGSPKPLRPSRTTTPSRTAPSGPGPLLVAFQQRIEQQARTGELDARTAGKIGDFIGKIAEKLGKGKTDELTGKIEEIRAKLTEAEEKGEWTADPETLQLLDRLRIAL